MNQQIARLFDRPIAFHPILARLTGSVTAALMLSQAIYWANRTDESGYFYKSQQEWQSETALSRSEQETARKNLRQFDFWIEERRGVPARLYYRVDFEALSSAILHANSPQSRLQDSRNLECRIPAILPAEIPHSFITETTTETTTENTTTNVVASHAFAKPKPARTAPQILMGEALENWLTELQSDLAYQSIAVRMEYAKMLRWCETRRQQPTRRRFIAWLNRIDTVAAPAPLTETPEQRRARLAATYGERRAA